MVKQQNKTVELEKEVSELKELVSKLLAKNNQGDSPKAYSATSMRKYIKVVSLFYGILNISTEPLGQGKHYQFDRFGYDQKIPDNVLADIIANDETKFKDGYCYIDDPEFVSEVGLSAAYEHVLSPQELKEAVRSKDVERVEALFARATSTQQETIVSLIVDKYVDEHFETGKDSYEDVNDAVVARLERKFNLNITEKIKDGISFRDMIKHEQELNK